MFRKKFALIGNPIYYTVSPFIHNQLFKQANISAEYSVIDIEPQNLANFVPLLKKLEGYNVTTPFKVEIINFLEKLSEEANFCGSVNTVKNEEVSCGYTTDGLGFLAALEPYDLECFKEAIILGCGGVARVLAIQAARKSCNITFAVREKSLEKAQKLAEMLKFKLPQAKFNVCKISEVESSGGILINATPIGTFPHNEEMPIDSKVLSNFSFVFDSIYNPAKTALLKKAQDMGIKTLNGVDMLVWQAAFAQRIWNQSEFDFDFIQDLIKKTEAEIENAF